MFTWNDEEISGIIWGEPGDSDDHIVPYPERYEGASSFPIRQCDKKSSILDDNNAVKTDGNNKLAVENDVLEDNVEASEYNTDEQLAASGFNLAWSDLPSSDVNITAQDSMVTEASKDFTAMENFNLGKGETELFGNEHGDTDGDSFLDYSWANIGNFDDLDRLFRNDESMLGRENLGNASELWSSSPVADMISNSPTRLFSVPADSPGSDFQGSRSTAAPYKVKLELPPYQDEPIDPASGNKNDFGFSGPPVLPSKNKSADIVNQAEDSTETTAETATLQSHQATENRSLKPVADKVNKPKKLAKNRKKLEVNSGKFSNTVSSTWPPGANSFQEYTNSRLPVSALQTFPSSVYSGSQSLSYLHATNPYGHMGYGYPVHQFPVVPQLQNVNSEKDPAMDSYKISSEPTKHLTEVQIPAGVQARVPAMTPREKIEKLRRRQQMQALVAIQQQQLKLGHQISGDHNWIKDEQRQDAVLSNAEADENVSTIHLQSSLELNFSAEQNDGSRMTSDEYSLAERIFLQLQEAITKLDNKPRLCIRDSLFRLAKSAIQRHAVSDTSSTNKNSRDEGDSHGFEETNSHERAAKMTEAETDTNQIDRTVAQLLFQWPSDLSSGPPMKNGPLESPVPGSPEKYHFNLKAENGEPTAEGLSELSDKRNMYQYDAQTAPLSATSTDPHQVVGSQATAKVSSEMDTVDGGRVTVTCL